MRTTAHNPKKKATRPSTRVGSPPSRGPSIATRAAPTAALGVQTKLRVGQPGDRYEREADEVAQRVTRGQDAPDISRIPAGGLGTQRRVDENADAQALQRALLVLHSPADEQLPIAHAERIFAAGRQPKSFVGVTDIHRWRHEWRKNHGNDSQLWGNEK